MTTIDLIIDHPGVYDMPHDAYLADPIPAGSLSSSGARKLLPPNCPARFRYEQDHPPAPKATFDLGHAAHQQVLGAGPAVVPVDAVDWRTSAARAARADAYAAGHVPLLAADYRQVQAMADALRQHSIANALFDPAHGDPEQSLFWVDADTDVWRRARFDWLPHPRHGGRLICADYKTTLSANPDHIERAVHNYGYYQQAAWYLDGITALGLAEDPQFVFVFQEKTPPHLITVAQLDLDAEQLGRERNRLALDTYRRCRDADHWPGYGADDIQLISLPPWATRRTEETP